MKYDDRQVEKLSLLITGELKKNDYVTLGSRESTVRVKIRDVILGNLKEEEQLDREVKRLMEAYARQIEGGEVDSRKVFAMIKGKLAKERGFVL